MKPRRKSEKIEWRKVLTDEESRLVAEADAAKKTWEALAAQRAMIVNRAIHRAKYRAGL